MSGRRSLNGTALAVQYHVRQAFDDGEPVTAAVLAGRLRVSVRTVERALSALVAAGRLAEDRCTPIGAAVRTAMTTLEAWASRVDLDSAAWRPVLVELARNADRFGWVTACGVDDIAKCTRASRSTVLRALSGLADQGVIAAHEEYARSAPGAPAVRSANSYQLNAGAQAKDPAREHREDHPAAHAVKAERLLSVHPVWQGFNAHERRAAVAAVAARLRNGWPYIVLFKRLHRRQDEDGMVREPYAVFRSRMRKIPVHYDGPVPDPETPPEAPSVQHPRYVACAGPGCRTTKMLPTTDGLCRDCREEQAQARDRGQLPIPVKRVPLPTCECGATLSPAQMTCPACGLFQLNTSDQRVLA